MGLTLALDPRARPATLPPRCLLPLLSTAGSRLPHDFVINPATHETNMIALAYALCDLTSVKSLRSSDGRVGFTSKHVHDRMIG